MARQFRYGKFGIVTVDDEGRRSYERAPKVDPKDNKPVNLKGEKTFESKFANGRRDGGKGKAKGPNKPQDKGKPAKAKAG